MYFQAITREEGIKQNSEKIKKCQAQEGASDSDVTEFLKPQVPTTESGKCLRACFIEAQGMVCQIILF